MKEINPDPRIRWAVIMALLLMLFPAFWHGIALAFDGGGLIGAVPLSLYYLLPASLSGELWFSRGNLGVAPVGFGGHALAAVVWGLIGAGFGLWNGQWHYRRAKSAPTE